MLLGGRAEWLQGLEGHHEGADVAALPQLLPCVVLGERPVRVQLDIDGCGVLVPTMTLKTLHARPTPRRTCGVSATFAFAFARS